MYTSAQFCCPGCQTSQPACPDVNGILLCTHCNATTMWYPQAPAPPPPPRTPRKKAVVCGINYTANPWLGVLEGCDKDALSMKNLLTNCYGFQDSDIFMLTEEKLEHTGCHETPTKENIISALSWLLHECYEGDSLVFYFSGHGTQCEDNDGDELDGKDECIVALDCKNDGSGVIIDDELNMLIVNDLPPGVKLHAIIDACRSGTLLDLECLWHLQSDETLQMVDQYQNMRRSLRARKNTKGGDVICLSACDDSQRALEIKSPQADTERGGVMTKSFVEVIVSTWPNLITYESLVKGIHESLRRRIPDGEQEPRLASNKYFDVKGTMFSL